MYGPEPQASGFVTYQLEPKPPRHAIGYRTSMRVCWLLILALVVSIASVQARASSASRFLGNRLSRSSDVDNNGSADEDERVPPVISRVFERFQKAVKGISFADDPAIKSWLKTWKTPTQVFRILKLEAAGAKLDDKTKLHQWLHFVVKHKAKEGDQAFSDLQVYFFLTKVMSEDELPAFFKSLEQVEKIKELGKNMEAMLSDAWIVKELQLKTFPTEIYKSLRIGTGGGELENSPKFSQWLKYVDTTTQRASTNSRTPTSSTKTDMVKLFRSLRSLRSRKQLAEEMRGFLFDSFRSTWILLDEAWLKSSDNPKTIFNLLGIRDSPLTFYKNERLIHWLGYVEQYRTKMGEKSFSCEQVYRMLEEAGLVWPGAAMATNFQFLTHIPGLMKLAENIQSYVMQPLVNANWLPEEVAGLLGVSKSISRFSTRKDPKFRVLEAYTVQFAAARGGDAVVKKVKALFASNKPVSALAAAAEAP